MDSLLEFLNEHFSAGPFTLVCMLETNGQRKAYRLQAPGGWFVAKLTDPGRPEAVVRADVGTPVYLCAQGFPAPRPLAARNGQFYLPYGDRFVYLYEYIEGAHPTPREDFYHRLGALLGRLHAIPPAVEIPLSEYKPEQILAETRAALRQVKAFIGDPGDLSFEQQQAIVPELLDMIVDMIDRFPSFAALPRGIIHTDPYFVNLIETPGGALYLIDWEDGGISYPLLDVGYVLAHLCSFTARDRKVWGVPGPVEGLVSRPDWARAFLEAYEGARPLTQAERSLLPDAVRLSFLAYMVNWEGGELILDNYRRMILSVP
jgi:Ser/Thr protein kinase RdoA (MazF antagonist)